MNGSEADIREAWMRTKEKRKGNSTQDEERKKGKEFSEENQIDKLDYRALTVTLLEPAGVVKELLEHGLLPNVITGASGGSIVAGMLAIKTDREMLTDVIVPDISTRYKERWFPSITEQMLHFWKHGTLMEVRNRGGLIQMGKSIHPVKERGQKYAQSLSNREQLFFP